MPEEQTTYTAEEWREEKGPSERELQEALADWARMQPSAASLLFCIPNGQYRPGQRKEAGILAGVPDLCLPCPRKDAGVLFIELKTGSNTLTDAQERVISELRDAGNTVHVCRELDTAISAIREHLNQ